jgi:DNA-binding transcriptional MerR regulator
MPYKEIILEKIQYPIGEVAKILEVDVERIRYWSNECSKDKLVNPKKNSGGNRVFSPDDLAMLKLIANLIRYNGLTFAQAKKRIIEDQCGESNNMEVVRRLDYVKSRLIEIRSALE